MFAFLFALSKYITVDTIKIGTRKSKLALWQSNYIKDLLLSRYANINVELVPIITEGDKTQDQELALPAIGGKGLFTAELETALLTGEIDLAVHSLKDLPTVMLPELKLAGICERGAWQDVLVTKNNIALKDLPSGSIIGSSSVRRIAQLKRIRPDLNYESIRGNVDTRLRKVQEDSYPYAGVVLAEAGLARLNLTQLITHGFTLEEMLPAPGQGALALQISSAHSELYKLLSPLNCESTALCVNAERDFLHYLNAGCNTPVAALAQINEDQMFFIGRCFSPDGREMIEVQAQVHFSKAASLGKQMAEKAIEKGYKKLEVPR